MTNGRRLFRVVCRVGTGVDDLLVSLEDCLTLEVRPCTPRELDAIGLRPVATSDGGAIARESIETYSPQDRSSAAVRAEARASAGGT